MTIYIVVHKVMAITTWTADVHADTPESAALDAFLGATSEWSEADVQDTVEDYGYEVYEFAEAGTLVERKLVAKFTGDQLNDMFDNLPDEEE